MCIKLFERQEWIYNMELGNLVSEYLYKAPGKLLVDYTNNGYKFGVDSVLI